MNLQYMIIKASKKKKLKAEVQSRLNEGCELQGAVCMDGVVEMGGKESCQA